MSNLQSISCLDKEVRVGVLTDLTRDIQCHFEFLFLSVHKWSVINYPWNQLYIHLSLRKPKSSWNKFDGWLGISKRKSGCNQNKALWGDAMLGHVTSLKVQYKACVLSAQCSTTAFGSPLQDIHIEQQFYGVYLWYSLPCLPLMSIKLI